MVAKLINLISTPITRFWLFFRQKPHFTIITTLAFAIVMALISLRISVNNDYETWLPKGNPATELFKEVNKDFSATGVVAVVLDLGEVFSEEGLTKIRRTTELLESIPGVFSATSLTNVVDFREAEGTVEVARLGDRIDLSPEGIREFRDYVLSRELYTGTFVSKDRRFANIIVNIQGDVDEIQVAGTIIDTIEKELGRGNVYLGGDPTYKVSIDQYMKKDLQLAVSVALVLMFLILFVSFRNIWATILPFATAGIAILWVMGIKALLGWPANITTPGVIILIFALGSAYAVHVVNRFYTSTAGQDPAKEIGPPVVMSALTTVFGLLTFATTRIPSLTWFGTEIAMGLVVSMFLSLTFLPAILQTSKFIRISPIEDHIYRPDWMAKAVYRLVGRGIQNRFFIIGLIVATGIGAAFWLLKITTSVNYLEMLPKKSRPIKASLVLREHFGGSFPQTIYFEGDIGDPASLKAMNRIGNFHRSLPDFSGYTSVADLIAEENFILNGSYSIPETKEGVSSLWLLLEGEPMLRNIVTTDRERGIISAFTLLEDTGSMARADATIQAFLDSEIDDELVIIDRTKLSPEVDQQIARLKIKEAAQEIAWLTAHYSSLYFNPNLESEVERHLSFLFPSSLPTQEIEGLIMMADICVENELFISDPERKDEVRDAAVVGALTRWNEKTPWRENLSEELCASLESIEPEEREAIADDLAFWIENQVRKLRVKHTVREIANLVPGILTPHFLKRSRGIFFELYSRYPAFFARKLEGIAIPDDAVVSRAKISIKQVGMPTLLTVFDKLLRKSQVQSFLLASLMVFFLIWGGLQVARGAFFAIITVQMSILITLGVMGLTGVPLDFGTVLTGGLIIGLGVDGVIHIIYQYRRSGSDPTRIAQTVSQVGRAVITANLTTAVGCYSLVLSSNKAMFNFAIINGSAILLVTFLNIILIPILIYLLPGKKT